jgi:myo-inositol-1(or 4)-monophosphatase
VEDVELAIRAVGDGATVVRRHFGTALERFDKGGGDFATAADVEAEESILGLLRAERPGDAILGEESGAGGPDGADRTWLVDPLCGTLNFAAGLLAVAVNVALEENGEVRVAAVADPATGETFWTDGEGAWLRRVGADERLAPSPGTTLVDLNLDPPFPNAPAFRAVELAADEEFIATFRPRVLSTSLALAWVATGRRAAYVTDGKVRGSVHFAAGLALCEAAGCKVTDLSGDTPSTSPTGLLAAADAQTHSTLLRLTTNLRTAHGLSSDPAG